MVLLRLRTLRWKDYPRLPNYLGPQKNPSWLRSGWEGDVTMEEGSERYNIVEYEDRRGHKPKNVGGL